MNWKEQYQLHLVGYNGKVCILLIPDMKFRRFYLYKLLSDHFFLHLEHEANTMNIFQFDVGVVFEMFPQTTDEYIHTST